MSAARRPTIQLSKVLPKLSTMVLTPTLTASASSSAIKASDNPDNCCRLSAQHHRQSERGAEQQRGQQGKAGNQRIAEQKKTGGGSKRGNRERSLKRQP